MKRILSVALLSLVLCGQAVAQHECKHGGGCKSAIEAIMTRTSVRSYQDQPVEQKKIEQLLRAGMAAPSAVNKQPWHFVVVTDQAVRDQLGAANPYAGIVKKAPLAIVVCGDMNKTLNGKAAEYWIQDCSAATENILIAANALGLGAVWTGTYPNEANCEAVAKALGLPKNLVPLNTIVIGYPKGETKPKDKWNPDNVSYNRFGGKE